MARLCAGLCCCLCWLLIWSLLLIILVALIIGWEFCYDSTRVIYCVCTCTFQRTCIRAWACASSAFSFFVFVFFYLIRSLSFSVRSSQCVCNISAFLWLFLCPGARASERASQRGAASVDWECGPGTECDSRQDRLRGAS